MRRHGGRRFCADHNLNSQWSEQPKHSCVNAPAAVRPWSFPSAPRSILRSRVTQVPRLHPSAERRILVLGECADKKKMRSALRRLTVLGLLLPGMLCAQEWGNLQPGMTRDEASAIIGRALISTSGRGFEVAIYDHRAELVFLEGKLVTWTAPASASAAAAPADTWRFEQIKILREPVAPIRKPAAPPVKRGTILPAYRL